MEKLVIMLPTYNENENIGEIIETLENNIFPQIKDFSSGILVVDDSSNDGTIDIVNEKMGKYQNIRISIGFKKGLGVAYKRGVEFAINEMSADIIIKMDADFQHNPIYIIEMLKKYRSGYKYVIGSRYCKGGAVPREWGLFRKTISKYGGLYTRIVLFFPKTRIVTDVSSGFALASVKDVLNLIDFTRLSSGFYYSQQLIYQLVNLGIEIAEIPIVFEQRKKNETKMPLTNIIGTLINMPALRISGIKHKR